MAFLDNSGDIILDAVLTDTGRMRLAKGDGSFKIAKFAFGDDEINYALFNKNHASGSAYYDINILQTPILEAFTNNTSMLKSKLLTITRTNLLYLPIIKRSIDGGGGGGRGLGNHANTGVATVLVDATTFNQFSNSQEPFIDGSSVGGGQNPIIFDQGIEATAIGGGGGTNPTLLDPDLNETQYILEEIGRASCRERV